MLRDFRQEDTVSSYYYSYDGSVKEMSSQERHNKLQEASTKYFHGKISDQELKQVEDELGVDYETISFGLTSAVSEVGCALRRAIKSILSKRLKD